MSLIDRVYERIESDTEAASYDKSDSEIAKFFANKTLFVTGVTGYLGKCIIEKLLRSCSDVKHVYVLMRGNERYSLEERMKRYFQNEIFNRLREEYPHFQEKVTVIKGDLITENLGLSEEDRSTIVNNVNIIYHNAANVKFDEKPSISLKANVLGTKKMLELAQQCPKIDLFVYVSTAYSHCYRKDIEEQFYPSPADLKTVYDAIIADEKADKGLTPKALQMLIGKYPNIYPFTKGIAEDLVKQYSQNAHFAHVIYRPSIVTFAHKEPTVGWYGSNKGLIVYIFLGATLGFFRTLYHLEYPMDVIPSDLCVNALLAVSRDAHNQWIKSKRQTLIYNYGSSTTNPINMGELIKLFNKMPAIERSSKAVWLCHPVFTKRLWLFYILHFLLHFLPASLIDSILLVSAKKPKALPIFWKVTQHLDKIDYFGNGNWKIHMPRTLEVIDKMSPADSEHFFCDIRKLCWEEEATIMWRGLKYYVLKEEITSEAGRRRYNLLWYLHYGTIWMCILTFLYFAFRLYNFIF